MSRDLSHGGHVLVVCDDADVRAGLLDSLFASGCTVEGVGSVGGARQAMASMPPDLLVVDIVRSLDDGARILEELRSSTVAQEVPLIFLATCETAEDAIRLVELGVDDYVRKPIGEDELVARVHGKLSRDRPSAEASRRHPGTKLVSEERLSHELAREIRRCAGRSGRSGCLAVLDVAEREAITNSLGARAEQDLRAQVSAVAASSTGEFDLMCLGADGQLLVLMPDSDRAHAKERLLRLSEHVAGGMFIASGESVNATPVVGFAMFGAGEADAPLVTRRAMAASHVAMAHLDLQPIEWMPHFDLGEHPPPKAAWTTVMRQRLRTPLQVLITFDIGVILPFIGYVLLDRAGVNIAPIVYIIVVLALAFTATLIWIEGFLALDPRRPPPAETASALPPATAIIAAYLPNEAATIIQTVESFLRVDYPGDLQVILAYNTPQPMPVEDLLAQIAARDPRFVMFRVEGSTSKAQNVNAALGQVNGEFVGVFDADHHPEPDSFRRAWRWLSNGYDVVQGHCAVRNGDSSRVARTVAVEFEAIYAVSHPGRARLHSFGIFGGSNGYWRTDLLRQVRMHGFMLTEDIDSSLRVVENGGRIASDPALVSWELAPTTLRALWNQRMRWAQGWFQVSRKHLLRGWSSDHMTFRQKSGFTILLAWREIYPWLSLQILPLLAFFAWKEGGVTHVDLLIPFFLLTTLFTLSVGPGQTYFAYRLAVPELRRRRLWFLVYLVVASIAYTEMKNVIGRVAQVKELTGDRKWKVTPRISGRSTPADLLDR